MRCCWIVLVLFFIPPTLCHAQDLTGVWQGEANNMPKRDVCLVGLTLDKQNGGPLTGSLHQEFEDGRYFVVFRLTATRLAKTLVVTLGSILADHHPDIQEWHWEAAPISFTYDEREEKLIGRNLPGTTTRSGAYTFTLFRVKLKSNRAVPVAVATTLRVSGRDVSWYTDPALKHLVARGNIFSTRLYRTTTFYLMQGFYPSRKSTATAITIRVKPRLKKQTPARAPLIAASAAPMVLPTLLFYTGTATLLPTASPALSQLVTKLRGRPAMRLRIAGHTDRVGEPDKNQRLSEQRATAVKAFLVQAGIGMDRLEVLGYGDTRELYPAPDARNRRVEITQIP